jgi:hypothetical protein
MAMKEKQPVFETIKLGMAPVSLAQICWFLDRPSFKVSSFWENIYYHFIGRYIAKNTVPMTCSLLVSYVLRMCGFKNTLHIDPRSLYKELKNGVGNHFWDRQSGKNRFGESVS